MRKTKKCAVCGKTRKIKYFYKWTCKNKSGYYYACKDCLREIGIKSRRIKSPKKLKIELFKKGYKCCSICSKKKKLSEFYVLKSGFLYSFCKKCWNIKTSKWAKNNKEKVKIIAKRHYPKLKERYKNDLNFRIRIRLSTRIKNILKNKTKYKSTIDFLGCNIPFFKKYIESKFEKFMTWKNYGRYGWHIDHIKPCAAFNLTKKSEQIKCFHYTNLQPLWAHENHTKSSKYAGKYFSIRNNTMLYVRICDPDSLSAERTQKRPFDCFCVYAGRFFCFELKQVREPESFSFDRVELHQKYYLSVASSLSNSKAYLLINYRFNSTEKIIEKYGLQKHENFVLAIDIDHFDILERMYETQCRKSIPFEFIVHMYKNGFIGTHVLPWIPKHKMWDVSALLNT
jgi:penicillin-binding protein-related factor A (putative recombinase)